MKGTVCCYQRPIQKPAPLMISGCISAYEFSNLNISESTISAKATYHPILQIVNNCEVLIVFLHKIYRNGNPMKYAHCALTCV